MEHVQKNNNIKFYMESEIVFICFRYIYAVQKNVLTNALDLYAAILCFVR
jgi:hypothetical protein